MLVISDFKICKQTLERGSSLHQITFLSHLMLILHNIMTAGAQVFCVNIYTWDQTSAAMILTNIFRNMPV